MAYRPKSWGEWMEAHTARRKQREAFLRKGWEMVRQNEIRKANGGVFTFVDLLTPNDDLWP